MVLSFVLLWVWFLARQSAIRGGEALHIGWNAALLLAVVALVVVLVRRMKRTLTSLREIDPAQRGRGSHN